MSPIYRMRFIDLKRQLAALTVAVLLLAPPIHKELTNKEVYPSIILPRGSGKVRHSRGWMPISKRQIMIVSLQGKKTVIPDFGFIVPPEIPKVYGNGILEQVYAEQQKRQMDERGNRRLEARRGLLLEWLSARGYDSATKIVIVTQTMVIDLRSGTMKEYDKARERTIFLRSEGGSEK